MAFECEIRKRYYMGAFNEYKTVQDRRKEKIKPKLNNKKSKQNNRKLNLSKSELNGLKSLEERIKQGELMVTSTDKSSRFAVLTQEQYLKSGLVHTQKDKEISWRNIQYIKTQLNSHMWWLTNITGYSKDITQQE